MSEHDNDPNTQDPGDDGERERVLAANVERLLQVEARPEVPAQARARMLARIQSQQPAQAQPEAQAQAQAQAQSRPRGPSHAPPPRDRSGGQKPSTPAAPLHNPFVGRVRLPAVLLTSLAAILILAWLFGVGDLLRGGDDLEEQLAHYSNDGLATREVTLADGSRALLRSGAALVEHGPRHLELTAGELLLEVVTADEPLVIETAQGRAVVTGTRLWLRLDGEQTLAAVLRGRASVQGKAGELLLRAGEQAVIDAAGEAQRVLGKRLTHEIDWARELLSPDDAAAIEPIRHGNLLARVPRWTGQLGPSPEWPLAVRRMVVDVHVEDGHVRTTVDQTFFNHVDRTLEGVYQFPLPPKAAISRLAMYVDGTRMEAGVVERDRGRDIYEQIVHRRRDPALLEWMRGNLFQVRIFPLPARSEKRVLLSYTQSLDALYDRGELRVPIPEFDLPVGEVVYRVRVVGGAKTRFVSQHQDFELREDGEDLLAEFRAHDHRVGDDIVADLLGAEGSEDPRVLRLRDRHQDGSEHLAVRVRPDLSALAPVATDAPARDLVVLFDTSASRGPAELEAQRRFLLALLAHLDDDDRLGVLAFDSVMRWSDAALKPVASLDRQALAGFLEREARIGLGTTDLGAAIDEGVAWLTRAGDPPSGDHRPRLPTLLYLGDGLENGLGDAATAGQIDGQAAALAQRIQGRAHFAAVSFGAGQDEPLLEALAAAGDGLHLHVDERDPLSWRALELLTILATPRVLELEAELLDAEGKVVAAGKTHADRRALADGERLELLTLLEPGAGEPVAVALRGVAANVTVGEPRAWTQRLELPPAADHDSRWIPRAWARAHVAALSQTGAEIEANAAEITTLGLEHFLVTPTTSLLVLENERMYRDFDVHRPPADAWARYDAPDTIEVVREIDSAYAGHGQYVVRTPIPVLVTYDGWGGSRPFGRTTAAPVTRAGPVAINGVGGLGLSGFGRGGGGTGEGFGIGLGNTGLIGFGGRGKRRDVADDFKTSKRKSVNEPSAAGEFRGFAARGLDRNAGWSRQQAVVTGSAGVDVPLASSFGAGIMNAEAALDGRFAYGAYGYSRPWPQAMSHPWDLRLDDLGELAPALFEDGFDLARETLLLTDLDAEATAAVRGSISDDARALIDAARRAQAGSRYALPEGGELSIDDDSRFAVISERWGFLDERVTYDGEQLRADYPELGLSVLRAVGPTSPALLSQWVPWLVPSADHLARYYTITLAGPRQLLLRPLSEEAGAAILAVDLDEAHRVVALRVLEAPAAAADDDDANPAKLAELAERSATRFRWDEDGSVTVLLPGSERLVRRLGTAAAIDSLARAQATAVSLPLPSPVDLADALEGEVAGSEAWITLQQQRLAGFAALGQHTEAAQVLDALREQAGRVLPGELTLGGAGLVQSDATLRERVLAATGDDPLATVIVAYLRAGASARSNAIGPMRKLVKDAELVGTPVHFMASYRALIHEAQRRPGAGAVKELSSFLQRYDHPELGYVATVMLTNLWWSKPTAKIDSWLALAEHNPRWKLIALHEAGLVAYQHGKTAEAAATFERAFREAAADGTLPIVDWTVQYAMTSTLGEAGWQLAWTRLRARVTKAKDPALAIGFLAAAQALGRGDEAQRVLDQLDPKAMDPGLALVTFDALLAYGRVNEAGTILAGVLARLPDDPAVLLRAASFATQQGRLDEAAAALEQALTLLLDSDGLTLDELRQHFASLFDLRARRARPLSGDAEVRQRALNAALQVADRWRLEDPDNPEIDQRCAELLWSVGRDDQAWRQLGSSIDRHPADGAAIAWVGDALERGGDFERADMVWARAIAVEPTDPQHRLRRAQNLLANGREDEAKALLQEIADGEWQPRFDWTKQQAKQLQTVLAR